MPSLTDLSKRCRECCLDLPLSSFHKSKDGKYGVTSKCKECKQAYKRRYYLQNSERLKQYSREFYEKNIESERESRKRYAEKQVAKKRKERIALREQRKHEVLALKPTDLKWCNAGQHYLPRKYFSKNVKKMDGLQVRCKECQKAYLLRNRQRIRDQKIVYAVANKEKIAARSRDYYARTREERIRYCREWYQEHRELEREKRKAAHNADPDLSRKRKRDWYHANPNKMKILNRRAYERKRDKPSYKAAQRRQGKIYYERHPEKVKAKSHRRRSGKGAFTPQQWLGKCEYFGWRCYLCSVPLTAHTASPDHRKPLISGGSNWIANIAPACRYCNAAKAAYSESEYRKRIALGLTKINPASCLSSQHARSHFPDPL